jgi:sigma-B regulation protein RsbU (phosphoserine phosphatase)
VNSLGHIPLSESCSLIEARRKIQRVSQALSGDSLIATRMATIASQAGRELMRSNAEPGIDVHLVSEAGKNALHLEFIGELNGVVQTQLNQFFDRVENVDRQDGRVAARGILQLPHATIDTGTVERLSGIVQQKTRDQLMQDVQAKNDELEESLENLRRTRTAKDRMESELNIGRDIQMSMLPLSFPAFPERHDFDIHAALYPAQEVGGDFYDLFLIDDEHLCFCVGDVSGKGVPAALFMAVTKTLIKSRADADMSPSNIVSHVNCEQSVGNESCMFVTLFLAILHLPSGEMVYCNAGHNPPYLQRSGGKLERLDTRHGPVIGAMEDMDYGESTLQLQPGDLVYLYTDGITEAMNSDRDLYGEMRLVEQLQDCDFDSAAAAVTASVDDVWAFQGDAAQADDITVLATRYNGSGPVSQSRELHLQLRNRLEEIDRANGAFSVFANALDLPAAPRQQVCLCLDEMLVNIISYGYPDGDEHLIDLHVQVGEDSLVITLSDDGIPFDPFAREEPDTELSVEDRPIGGLGVHLVKNLMDNCHYERRGEHNVVQLKKSFTPSGNKPT